MKLLITCMLVLHMRHKFVYAMIDLAIPPKQVIGLTVSASDGVVLVNTISQEEAYMTIAEMFVEGVLFLQPTIWTP